MKQARKAGMSLLQRLGTDAHYAFNFAVRSRPGWVGPGRVIFTEMLPHQSQDDPRRHIVWVLLQGRLLRCNGQQLPLRSCTTTSTIYRIRRTSRSGSPCLKHPNLSLGHRFYKWQRHVRFVAKSCRVWICLMQHLQSIRLCLPLCFPTCSRYQSRTLPHEPASTFVFQLTFVTCQGYSKRSVV